MCLIMFLTHTERQCGAARREFGTLDFCNILLAHQWLRVSSGYESDFITSSEASEATESTGVVKLDSAFK